MSLAPQQKNTWVLFAAETVVTKVVFSFSRTFSQGKQIFLQLCTCTLCMFICETASESTDEPVTSIDISRRVKHPRGVLEYSQPKSRACKNQQKI